MKTGSKNQKSRGGRCAQWSLGGGLTLLLVACGGGGAIAADAGGSGESLATPTSATGSAGTASITPIDRKAVPTRIDAGDSTRRIAQTGEVPARDVGAIGAWRTVCRPSHFNFDDALVFPGRAGATHLHVYFGNTAVDANSTPASIRDSGNSTCRGGIVNRSAYWVPAMIDTRTGAPLVPTAESFVYYKTGYLGVRDADVRAVPPNFRMIAGDSKSRSPQSNQVVRFACNDGQHPPTIRNCTSGDLTMTVIFPQCWDGVNATSPDFRSHVAYPTEGRGCIDPRFPVAIPEISYQIHYTVPPEGTGSWRLSSDIEGTPAGSSSHADWVNGWEEDVMRMWITQVINPGYSTSGGLGSGMALY